MSRITSEKRRAGSARRLLWGASLVLLALPAGSCSRRAPRSPNAVMSDVGLFTVRVQRRSDTAARTCHRATTEAAVAVANVLGPLERHETVTADKLAALDKADRVMLSTCSGFRKPWTEP